MYKRQVLLNDKVARASAEVKAGDVITIQFGNKDVKVEVLTCLLYTSKRA